jgi:hypothetical protein
MGVGKKAPQTVEVSSDIIDGREATHEGVELRCRGG